MKPQIQNKVKELLAFAEKHRLGEMVWRENGTRISFRRGPKNTSPEEPVQETPTENGQGAVAEEQVVRSPIVGRFRLSPTKDRPPLVVVGNHVKPGMKLAFVDCMKIPTDVVSFCAGKITKILVEDNQPVEYGQALFTVQPEDEA